jgi:pyruvate kinase
VSETRTKIVATMGPALDPAGALERLLAEGVDVLRVNLSHGAPPDHAARVARARATQPDVAVLADLCGPKLRLGEFAGAAQLADGQLVTLGRRGLPVADPHFARRVRKGDPVYLADGTIKLEAVAVTSTEVECRVLAGGSVTARKGVNLPNDASDLPCLSDKDLRDLDQLKAIEPDFVALSYVRDEGDIAALRRKTTLPVIAKIEKQQALDRLEAIIAAADGIMVARGDLGVEIPIERVPAAQKRMIRLANEAAKPVITATQMLVSMVSNPLPTRAEVTDVANAVLDGTDAVMLSEETAVGRDPAGAVRMMERILRETEPLLPSRLDAPSPAAPASAIARAATHLARDLEAAAILVPTLSGSSAVRVAAFRPVQPILAFSPRPETARRLGIAWGVRAQVVAPAAEGDVVGQVLAEARRVLPAGSRVVVIAGWPPGVAGNTSFIHTERL